MGDWREEKDPMRFGTTTICVVWLLSLELRLFGATNQPVILSEEQRRWIAQQPALHVGITPEWAPFSYFGTDGKATGIDIEILNLISQRTGLRFEVVRADSWKETLKLVGEGQVDLVSGVAQTGERSNLFEFTQSYFRAPVVIVARETDHRFPYLATLSNAHVAMPRKHVTTLALQRCLPETQLTLTSTLPESFELVARGKADAVVANLFTANRYFNDHPRARLGICGVIPQFDFPLRFGVRRNQTMLREILDRSLDSISQTEINDITSRHLMFGLAGEHRTEFLKRRIMQVTALALGITLLLGIWNYSLYRQVRARRIAEEELRQINRSLEIFSHSISHDLRAPLRAISGFAGILKQDYGEKLGDEGKSYLDRIDAAADRMNNLMRDILAYSHASRGNLSFSSVSLHKLVQQLIGEFPVEQRGYFEIVNELPDVTANPTLLSQCLANLLSNAVKFVPKGDPPKIRISAEREGDFVKLWVEDNGIGIAPENQQRIFQAFERVQTEGYEGTGIGLAIVAKGIERMGGRVGVESALGTGSRFWIQLPAGNSKS